MSVLAAVMLLAVFLAVCLATTLAFALSLVDRPSGGRQVAFARRRAELAEPPPIDAQCPRLPL